VAPNASTASPIRAARPATTRFWLRRIELGTAPVLQTSERIVRHTGAARGQAADPRARADAAGGETDERGGAIAAGAMLSAAHARPLPLSYPQPPDKRTLPSRAYAHPPGLRFPLTLTMREISHALAFVWIG
jgi:hypothetical protein